MTEISIIIEDVLSGEVADYLTKSGYKPYTKQLNIKRSEVPMYEIISLVAHKYGISPEDLRGKNRKEINTLPRHITCYVIKTLYPLKTWKEIGRVIGGRDHATIMNAFSKINNIINGKFSHTIENREFKEDVNSIIQKFK